MSPKKSNEVNTGTCTPDHALAQVQIISLRCLWRFSKFDFVFFFFFGEQAGQQTAQGQQPQTNLPPSAASTTCHPTSSSTMSSKLHMPTTRSEQAHILLQQYNITKCFSSLIMAGSGVKSVCVCVLSPRWRWTSTVARRSLEVSCVLL